MKPTARLLLALFLVGLAIILPSCSDDGPSIEVEPVRRTVLVYMIATNNLSSFAVSDFREMIDGANSGAIADDARWIVYLVSYSRPPQLIEFTPSDTILLKEYSDDSSATYSRMTEVFDDVAALAPADTYGLVLWSHGSGWIANGLEDEYPDIPYDAAPLSFGSDHGMKMNIATIRAALKGRRFDYIYFDACHMNTVEVAYELRDAVSYIVGSPAETPADGMNYTANMAPLTDGSRDALIAAARNTFEDYEASHRSIMSVIATEPLQSLADATAAIYSITPLDHPADNVTNYYGVARYDRFIDFGEYVTSLADKHGVAAELVDKFNDALARTVIYSEAPDVFFSPMLYQNLPIYNASGLSTYVFPTPEAFTRDNYDSLRWARDVVSQHLHQSE